MSQNAYFVREMYLTCNFLVVMWTTNIYSLVWIYVISFQSRVTVTCLFFCNLNDTSKSEDKQYPLIPNLPSVCLKEKNTLMCVSIAHKSVSFFSQ